MTPRILLATVALAVAAPAGALQPLDRFLAGARTASPDVAEARAARRQAGAEATSALGRALPRLSLSADYVRNEFETTLAVPGIPGGPPASAQTLSPLDERRATATLDVPLVDLASFARIGAARTGARAAAQEERSTALRVESLVSQDYHQLVANLALVGASRRALEVSRASLATAEARREAGTVPLLDVDRARAEVERNVQQLAGAELQVALVARSLRSRTGLEPELGAPVTLADDLREEPPLERFQVPDEAIPSLAAAVRSRAAAEQQARAQKLALVPSLRGTVTEWVSDFETGGQNDSWQAIVGLTWSFDVTTLGDIAARGAAAEGARARERRARLAARDDIHAAWMTVRSNVARSRAARAQAEVSARAADLARQRYEVGEGTQLDLLQAQRDAFTAEAGRIQADADLVNSRAQLRLAAGESLLAPAPRRAP
jgi:outer membrane protein TolC